MFSDQFLSPPVSLIRTENSLQAEWTWWLMPENRERMRMLLFRYLRMPDWQLICLLTHVLKSGCLRQTCTYSPTLTPTPQCRVIANCRSLRTVVRLWSFLNRQLYKRHRVLSDNSKFCNTIQLSYNEIGTTNPLHGHLSMCSVGVFYFFVKNLP